MAKNKKKRKIKIFFTDGKVDIVPQRLWDDYEVNNELFVIKKHGEWIAFLQDGHYRVHGSWIRRNVYGK